MTTIATIVVICTLIGMSVWLGLVVKHKKWPMAIGPITYFTSILVLYTVYYCNLLTPVEINMWSNVIRLESIFLFIILGIVLWKRGTNLWI
jgi:hypothetical protein